MAFSPVWVLNDESRQKLKMHFPKDTELNPESLGEEAHFVFQETQTFGVANDVGGWAKKGLPSEWLMVLVDGLRK
ncbi:unnamed protein product, partial [Dovyalis caffra]